MMLLKQLNYIAYFTLFVWITATTALAAEVAAAASKSATYDIIDTAAALHTLPQHAPRAQHIDSLSININKRRRRRRLQHQQQQQQSLRHESYDIRDNNNNNNNDNDNYDESIDALLHTRSRREVTDWLIAPNTRWCGRGNTANGTYNYLGGASSADKCCRKHDHCKLFIPAMSNRYELFNYRPYTLSHCNCDRRFRTCLKLASDEDANTIGKLFFNMVQTQCFILKTEHVCQERSTDGSGECLRKSVRHKAYLKNNKKF